MVTDGTHRAILDRIVDGETAVLILEEADTQLEIPVRGLPRAGREEGAVLEVVSRNGRLEDLTYLREETREREEAAQDRFDRLSERLGDEP